ncbi:MAG: RNA 2',3'-cyclic phosphodiesterase, partial [Spirochaetota bacterium]
SKERTAALIPALEAITLQPCAVTVKGAGTFPGNSQDIKVLWAGVEKSADLMNLASSVEKALCGCGIPKEPLSYIPHITLGRAKPPVAEEFSGFLAKNRETVFGNFTADHFSLYSSDNGAAGPVYTPIHDFPLA